MGVSDESKAILETRPIQQVNDHLCVWGREEG